MKHHQTRASFYSDPRPVGAVLPSSTPGVPVALPSRVLVVQQLPGRAESSGTWKPELGGGSSVALPSDRPLPREDEWTSSRGSLPGEDEGRVFPEKMRGRLLGGPGLARALPTSLPCFYTRRAHSSPAGLGLVLSAVETNCFLSRLRDQTAPPLLLAVSLLSCSSPSCSCCADMANSSTTFLASDPSLPPAAAGSRVPAPE